MAYEKHLWECGEVVTDAKMNNIENGIEEALTSGGGAVIIKAASIVSDGDEKTVVTDKTWQEVHDAFMDDIPCYVGFDIDGVCNATTAAEIDAPIKLPVLVVIGENDAYNVVFVGVESPNLIVSALQPQGNSPSGYLALTRNCNIES